MYVSTESFIAMIPRVEQTGLQTSKLDANSGVNNLSRAFLKRNSF